jgi:anti-sigma regulatory factor (Ser/Thr protein kinase)
LHAELEGGAYLPNFELLLRGWQQAGVAFRTLSDAARSLDPQHIRTARIETGTLEGRSGTLAVQAAE